MSDAMIVISDATFDATIAQGVTLVDFWAPWCGPCKALMPTIEAIAGEMQGRAKIAKANVDEVNETAVKFQISVVPTLLIFKDGDLKEKIVGVREKSDIVAAIEKQL